MLSYRHAFHAGNFADVHKHAVLVQLLLALGRKPKPFCVLDTHAGAGRYDLAAERALLNREFDAGIGRLWGLSDATLGPELTAYVDLVRARNPDGALRGYPGSPLLTQALLRADDALIACELHPADHPDLSALFAADARVAVHRRDGYEAVRALLPPTARRGLVFCDPAYEVPGEFTRLTSALAIIRARWAGAVVALWYPILGREPSEAFLTQIKRLGMPGTLCCELGLWPYRDGAGLNGSGMVIVNAPWGLAEPLERLLTALAGRLHAGPTAQTRLDWLVPLA